MKRKEMETARMSITMPLSTKEAVGVLAEKMGVSESYAAQHLLKIGLTNEAIAYAGGEIIARLPSGEQRVLADKSGNFLHRVLSFGS